MSSMLDEAIGAVLRFMDAGGQDSRKLGDYPNMAIFRGWEDVRMDLLKEEVKELADAVGEGDLTEIADALADITYVVLGTALCYGIPLGEIFDEVHRSNMAKFANGVVKREDGKILKPAGWKPPDVAGILEKYKKVHEARG